MSDDPRASLATGQARLVAALRGRSDVPERFDAARVELAARTLLSKRRKGVARAWPALSASLGERFAERLAAFAFATPPHPAGPAADGYAFARWLDRQHQLPDDAVPEFLVATLRRGPRVAIALRRSHGSLLLAIRLPFAGVRLVRLRARR